MQLTTKVKLYPTEEQRKLLFDTMKLYNEACNRISEIAFNADSRKQFDIHRLCYNTIREEFPTLSSQMVVRAIAKVSGQMKREFVQHTFKPLGAIQYDSRLFSFKAVDEVSLWCIGGRQRIKMIMTGYQKKTAYESKKQANLVFIDNQFYLLVVIDTDEKEPIITDKVIGVDFGIVKIATLNDSTSFNIRLIQKLEHSKNRGRVSIIYFYTLHIIKAILIAIILSAILEIYTPCTVDIIKCSSCTPIVFSITKSFFLKTLLVRDIV